MTTINPYRIQSKKALRYVENKKIFLKTGQPALNYKSQGELPAISTIVIAYNEEDSIERCLKSVKGFSDEIIVVDSQSTDGTARRARVLADKVVTHTWEGYSNQKTFAVSLCRNDWIFWIDADEEATPELQKEICKLKFDKAGYSIKRHNRYLEKWIDHGTWNPDIVLRLFRKNAGHFSDVLVHEHVVLNGPQTLLENPLNHYSYQSISHHLSKMNRFTTLAAKQMLSKGKKCGVADLIVRPVMHFLKSYIFRKGFLDGRHGIVIAVLDGYYTFQKYAKLWEIDRSHAYPAHNR